MQRGGAFARSVPEHATIVHAVYAHALRDGLGTIGVVDDLALSYHDFWCRIAASAHRLREIGVRPGDRVGVEMATDTAVLCSTLGVLACGATLVPLCPVGQLREGGRDGRKFLESMRLAQARWCLVDAHARESSQQLLDTGGIRPVVLDVHEIGAASDQPASLAGGLPVELDPEQTALIQFSSGTTGAPKGIVLTHANLAANLHALVEHVDGWEYRQVNWLPLDHDMGLIGSFASALYGGGTLRLLPPTMFVADPLRWITALSDFGATHTGTPPFGYAQAAARARNAQQRLASCDLSQLRVCLVGAERITSQMCREFEDTFAPYGLRAHTFMPAYGLAENCVAVACSPPLRPRTVRTVDREALAEGMLRECASPLGMETIGHGRALPGTAVRIASADGRVLAEDAVGEIQISGAATARHLIDQHGALVPADVDGWVPTGDLGAVSDGELYVVGRVKDVFKHGGQTFAPADIEYVVGEASLPGVRAVAAVAVSSPGLDRERLLLCLELVPDTCPSEVATACRLAVLRGLGLPVDEVFTGVRGDLPRTTSGKIQRSRLDEAYSGGDGEQLLAFRRVLDVPREPQVPAAGSIVPATVTGRDERESGAR